jgi:hypothetical protein
MLSILNIGYVWKGMVYMIKETYINDNYGNNQNRPVFSLTSLFSNTKKAEAKKRREEIIDLVNCIKEAREDWKNANANFNYADDADKIDYYAFYIKACQLRYEYFLKKARRMNVNLKRLYSK